jgi:hypothetical protein
MTKAACSDEEFIEAWNVHKSADAVSRALGIQLRAVFSRRRNIEHRLKICLRSDSPHARHYDSAQTHHLHKQRLNLGIRSGTVLVFSDAHFWPGVRTTAFQGLLWAIKTMKPKAVICNGDAFDGASISRYPRIGWDSKPSVIQELQACKEYLGEIEQAALGARYNAKLVWPLGNHDARFENRLAANAGEYEGVHGFKLKDHFLNWEPCWSCWLTDDVVVKHRYKGGIHATHNNTVMSGKSIVTGHLHSLRVTPFDDYGVNGKPRTRYGVDTGTLADPDGPQFSDYLEENPTNWRSGFVVLTFNDGRLMWPEVVKKFSDGKIEFRGKVIDV